MGKRSSGVRSLSDIYPRCNGCLELGDDFSPRKIAFLPFFTLLCQINQVLSKLFWGFFFGMGKDSPFIL